MTGIPEPALPGVLRPPYAAFARGGGTQGRTPSTKLRDPFAVRRKLPAPFRNLLAD